MQYKLVMFLSKVACHTPYRLLMAVGWVLGNLYYLLIKKERERAVSQMMPALGIEEPEARHLVRLSFINLARNVLEILYMPHLSEKNFGEYIEIDHLERLTDALAEGHGVAIVTGDTKVVEHGKADGIFINTAGIGDIIPGTSISPHHVKPGMKVLLSGFIGDHAATVLAGRHGLELPDTIKTDCAPLNSLTRAMLEAAPDIAVLRDPTRGGVAAVLNEIAEASHCGVLIDEDALPIREEVRGVCDILGFDPLYLANEGKCIAFVPAEEADEVLAVMRENPYGKDACLIGEVTAEAPGQVGLRTAIGGIRIVDMPLGNLVPRIC